MQFDPLDKKIREAADLHHPAYDEHAWKKMKRLLDQHMPQKERKRRFLILIPLFLLLGGGSLYLVFRPGAGKPDIAEDRRETTAPSKDDQASGGQISAPVNSTVVEPTGDGAVQVPVKSSDITISNLPVRKSNHTVMQAVQADRLNSAQQENEMNGADPVKAEAGSQDMPDVKEPVTTAVTNKVKAGTTEPPEETKTVAGQTNTDIGEVGKKTGVEPVKTEEKAEPVAKENKKKKTANRFFFYASAGADRSFTRQLGDTRMLAGAGAGFTIRERFMIRTGLFTARKVYSASPGEYDPPAAFWNYYPNLEKVDADCKVYELPLLVSYQFGRNSRQSWMATAGISTLFMKEEKYRYYYKPTPSSPLTTRDYTLKNESDHPFSVITLSGGYKRNLGKKVTIMAEPYVKLPLSGVGYGKVKLNSGGIMVSVGISPF